MKVHVVRAPGTDRYRLPVPERLDEVRQTPILQLVPTQLLVNAPAAFTSLGTARRNTIPGSFNVANNKWTPGIAGLYVVSYVVTLSVDSVAAGPDNFEFSATVGTSSPTPANSIQLLAAVDSTVLPVQTFTATAMLELDETSTLQFGFSGGPSGGAVWDLYFNLSAICVAA